MTYTSSIEEDFRQLPPASTKEARSRRADLTGIKRSECQIRKFIKRLGMKRLKVGHIPSKANPDKQENFKQEQMEPVLEEAKKGKRFVYFVDAAPKSFSPLSWLFVVFLSLIYKSTI